MNGMTKRILSVLLTLCMLLSVFPVTALGLDTVAVQETSQAQGEVVKGSDIPGTPYHVTSVKHYSIAPDISERIIVTNNAAGNSQTVANVMEVNPNNGRATIVAGYGNRNPKELGWTLKTTTDQAHVYEQESGMNVVGGVNASWFNINTGEPSGYLVMNGVVHHDSSSRAYVAAFDDGSVNVFREGTTLAQAEADQSAKQGKTVKIIEAVDALVAMVWDGEVVVSESGNNGYYPRTSVGIKADGTVVLFQADGTMAPRSVGYTAAEEARMMVALGCVAAIQLDEGGSSTYISQREGEDDLTMRNTPAGGSERVVSGTILVVSTVAASGEFDHAAITPDEEYYTPGSTVELTAEAMDYSGAPAKALPADVTFALSDETMGTLSDAVVDGSGATVSFTSSGKTGSVTVQMLSGGAVVGTALLHVQEPDTLAFASGEVNLNYNQVSDLGFKATYQTETVNLKDGDIQWTISDTGAGSFSNNLFTATSNVKYSGSPTVTATRGGLSATVTLNIGMAPTMIVDGGDEDVWDYSNIGTTVESFANMDPSAVVTYHYAGRGGVVKGSVVSDTDEEFADIVRFGHNAIKLDYDWTGLTGTDGACLGLGAPLAIDGTPTALGVWVYIPEGVPVPWLRAQIATSSDGVNWTNAYINFTKGSTEDNLKAGWQYLEADLTQYAGTQLRANSGMLFRAMAGASAGFGWYTADGTLLDKSQLKGWILLDNFCVVYGSNNQDVTPPTVNSIQLVNNDGTKTELENGAVLSSSDQRFFVTYDDNEVTDPFATGVESAYFYFDGTYYGKFDKDNLGSTSYQMHFGNGQHAITFYLKDGYGNITRETRYFTVEAEDTKLPGVNLVPVGAPQVGKTWELNFVSDDLASITSLDTTVSISSNYPVSDVIFPEGVTGSYSYNAAKGALTVEISTIDHTVFKAEQLATIQVNIPYSVTEGSSLNVQVSKGSFGCKQTEGITEVDELMSYVAGFIAPVTNYPVEATYRIRVDSAVVGSNTAATVTVIRNGRPASGVSVYADDVLLGKTVVNGKINISNLTATQGSVALRAMDEAGNCSYQITLFSYDAVGDETGAPYNVIYNVAPSADGKTITWMSNPSYSGDRAIAQIADNADMTGAVDVDGSSRLISYSSSKVINRVNSVSLAGLIAGDTYYYRVGDGSTWSEVRSFTVPVIEEQTRFFLLADIQEEDALLGMGRIAAHLGDQYHFGVQLGDAVDNVRYYNQWEDALSLFTLDGIRETDVLHVVGNHEADDDGNDAIAAKTVFGVPAAWYSVERGDVYIAVLNHTSNQDTIQQFTQWLVEDAAKSDCTWKVLVTHVPAYYTNPTGGGEIYIQYLPAACDAAGIDFYFSGNDHSYARTAPLTAGQVSEDGTVYYICGSTGGKSYSLVNNPDFHFEAATIDFDSVYMDVTADRFQATVTAYNVAEDGTVTVLDQYTKRTVPLCENEHTYVYDRTTGELECPVCGHSENAAEVQYNGWATERVSGRRMYFTAGKYVTGYLFLDEVNYNFDAEGLVYTGDYVMDGRSCTFQDGQFIPTETILLAGICGESACFVLYRDGRMVITGSGSLSPTSRATVPWQTVKDGVRKVYVSAGITNLSTQCFYYCSMMTDLIFENGSQLAIISGSAFNGCSRLVRINLEDCSKLTLISGSAFYDCRSLTSIVLPESLRTINGRAFARCTALNSVYMPDEIGFISSTAFESCGGVILSVAYNSYAEQYAIRNNIAYTVRAAKVIASGSCGDSATWELYGDGVLNIKGSGTLTNPKAASGIAWHAYRDMICVVNIEAGITNLPDFAFYGCANLEELNFAEGSLLASIGGSALRNCTALREVTLPQYVYTIYGNAFRGCTNLTSVYLPDGVSYIANSAFSGCKNVVLNVGYSSYAKEYAVRNGIQYVERQPSLIASGSCGVNATWELYSDGILNIKGSGDLTNPTTISGAVWYTHRHAIREVNIEAGITNLPDYAFYGCTSLEMLNFAEGSALVSIGGSVFNGCAGLKELILPECVRTIYGNAFRNCTNLSFVYLPDSVSHITNNAFRGCDKVVLGVGYNSYAKQYAISNGIAYVERQPESIGSGSCGTSTTWELYSDGTLNIKGSGALTNPKTSNGIAWYAYRHMIREVNVGAGITNLPDFAFFGCYVLETVSFAENSALTTIGGSTFNGCTSLKELTLPERVRTIYGNAFRNCTNLSSVYLPDTVSYITGNAFGGCSKVVLSVARDSYAKQYAINNGIAYVER